MVLVKRGLRRPLSLKRESLMVSESSPMTNMTLLTMSQGVKSADSGAPGGKEAEGALRDITGRLTVNTQIIWKIQNARNLKKLSLVSSNLLSSPILMILYRRYPDNRR